jgi:preprotein translocase subunit SecF
MNTPIIPTAMATPAVTSSTGGTQSVLNQWLEKPVMVDVVKHRWLYIGLSLLVLIPGLVFMGLSIRDYPTHAPIRLGVDFTGGTLLEYASPKPLNQNSLPVVKTIFAEQGLANTVAQLRQGHVNQQANQAASIITIRSASLTDKQLVSIQQALKAKLGDLKLLQKNAIGPTLANELLTNGIMALLLAYVLIVGYLTFRFQLDYALCAIFALVHDTLFVFGTFSMLGYLFHTEIDSLFITGILTVVGFSVHDTIVVFDRLRENSRLLHSKKLPFGTIANISVNQTLRRSINTSMTAMLTLLSLYLFGGATTRDFVLCMLLGIFVGTYSSIFVATSMLAWWRGRHETPQSLA